MLTIEHLDLTSLHTLACFIGVPLCLYVMQVNGQVDRLLGYSKFASQMTRFSMALIGISLMWAAAYPSSKGGWQPWPPDVLIILAIDLALFMRSVTIAIRW